MAPAGSADHAVWAAKCHALVQALQPRKAHLVDGLLNSGAFKGQPERLYQNLVAKFGPMPEAAEPAVSSTGSAAGTSTPGQAASVLLTPGDGGLVPGGSVASSASSVHAPAHPAAVDWRARCHEVLAHHRPEKLRQLDALLANPVYAGNAEKLHRDLVRRFAPQAAAPAAGATPSSMPAPAPAPGSATNSVASTGVLSTSAGGRGGALGGTAAGVVGDSARGGAGAGGIGAGVPPLSNAPSSSSTSPSTSRHASARNLLALSGRHHRAEGYGLGGLGDGAAPAAVAAADAEWEACCKALLLQHRPSRVGQLEKLLAAPEYTGRPEALYRDLEKRYGDGGAAAATATTATAAAAAAPTAPPPSSLDVGAGGAGDGAALLRRGEEGGGGGGAEHAARHSPPLVGLQAGSSSLASASHSSMGSLLLEHGGDACVRGVGGGGGATATAADRAGPPQITIGSMGRAAGAGVGADATALSPPETDALLARTRSLLTEHRPEKAVMISALLERRSVRSNARQLHDVVARRLAVDTTAAAHLGAPITPEIQALPSPGLRDTLGDILRGNTSEGVNEAFGGRGQTQVPAPTPSPMAEPFAIPPPLTAIQTAGVPPAVEENWTAKCRALVAARCPRKAHQLDALLGDARYKDNPQKLYRLLDNRYPAVVDVLAPPKSPGAAAAAAAAAAATPTASSAPATPAASGAALAPPASAAGALEALPTAAAAAAAATAVTAAPTAEAAHPPRSGAAENAPGGGSGLRSTDAGASSAETSLLSLLDATVGQAHATPAATARGAPGELEAIDVGADVDVDVDDPTPAPRTRGESVGGVNNESRTHLLDAGGVGAGGATGPLDIPPPAATTRKGGGGVDNESRTEVLNVGAVAGGSMGDPVVPLGASSSDSVASAAGAVEAMPRMGSAGDENAAEAIPAASERSATSQQGVAGGTGFDIPAILAGGASAESVTSAIAAPGFICPRSTASVSTVSEMPAAHAAVDADGATLDTNAALAVGVPVATAGDVSTVGGVVLTDGGAGVAVLDASANLAAAAPDAFVGDVSTWSVTPADAWNQSDDERLRAMGGATSITGARAFVDAPAGGDAAPVVLASPPSSTQTAGSHASSATGNSTDARVPPSAAGADHPDPARGGAESGGGIDEARPRVAAPPSSTPPDAAPTAAGLMSGGSAASTSDATAPPPTSLGEPDDATGGHASASGVGADTSAPPMSAPPDARPSGGTPPAMAGAVAGGATEGARDATVPLEAAWDSESVPGVDDAVIATSAPLPSAAALTPMGEAEGTGAAIASAAPDDACSGAGPLDDGIIPTAGSAASAAAGAGNATTPPSTAGDPEDMPAGRGSASRVGVDDAALDTGVPTPSAVPASAAHPAVDVASGEVEGVDATRMEDATTPSEAPAAERVPSSPVIEGEADTREHERGAAGRSPERAAPGGAAIAADIADRLYVAMKGFGTDEAAIYTQLARVDSQPMWEQVTAAFRTWHPKFMKGDLLAALRDELTRKELDKAERMLRENGVAMFPSAGVVFDAAAADAMADRLYKAMKGFGTDEAAIYAQLECVQAQGQWEAVRDAFRVRYPTFAKGDILAALRDELTWKELGKAERILRESGVDMFSEPPLQPQTPASAATSQSDAAIHGYDAAAATDIVDRLYKAMKGFGTDEDAIYTQLARVDSQPMWEGVGAAFQARYPKFVKGDLLAALRDELTRKELGKAERILRENGVEMFAAGAPVAAEEYECAGPSSSSAEAQPPPAGTVAVASASTPGQEEVWGSAETADAAAPSAADDARENTSAAGSDNPMQPPNTAPLGSTAPASSMSVSREPAGMPPESVAAVETEAVAMGTPSQPSSATSTAATTTNSRPTGPPAPAAEASTEAVGAVHAPELVPAPTPAAIAHALYAALCGFELDEAAVHAQLGQVGGGEAWRAVRTAFAAAHPDAAGGDVVAALREELTGRQVRRCEQILRDRGVDMQAVGADGGVVAVENDDGGRPRADAPSIIPAAAGADVGGDSDDAEEHRAGAELTAAENAALGARGVAISPEVPVLQPAAAAAAAGDAVKLTAVVPGAEEDAAPAAGLKEVPTKDGDATTSGILFGVSESEGDGRVHVPRGPVAAGVGVDADAAATADDTSIPEFVTTIHEDPVPVRATPTPSQAAGRRTPIREETYASFNLSADSGSGEIDCAMLTAGGGGGADAAATRRPSQRGGKVRSPLSPVVGGPPTPTLRQAKARARQASGLSASDFSTSTLGSAAAARSFDDYSRKGSPAGGLGAAWMGSDGTPSPTRSVRSLVNLYPLEAGQRQNIVDEQERERGALKANESGARVGLQHWLYAISESDAPVDSGGGPRYGSAGYGGVARGGPEGTYGPAFTADDDASANGSRQSLQDARHEQAVEDLVEEALAERYDVEDQETAVYERIHQVFCNILANLTPNPSPAGARQEVDAVGAGGMSPPTGFPGSYSPITSLSPSATITPPPAAAAAASPSASWKSSSTSSVASVSSPGLDGGGYRRGRGGTGGTPSLPSTASPSPMGGGRGDGDAVVPTRDPHRARAEGARGAVPPIPLPLGSTDSHGSAGYDDPASGGAVQPQQPAHDSESEWTASETANSPAPVAGGARAGGGADASDADVGGVDPDANADTITGSPRDFSLSIPGEGGGSDSDSWRGVPASQAGGVPRVGGLDDRDRDRLARDPDSSGPSPAADVVHDAHDVTSSRRHPHTRDSPKSSQHTVSFSPGAAPRGMPDIDIDRVTSIGQSEDAGAAAATDIAGVDEGRRVGAAAVADRSFTSSSPRARSRLRFGVGSGYGSGVGRRMGVRRGTSVSSSSTSSTNASGTSGSASWSTSADSHRGGAAATTVTAVPSGRPPSGHRDSHNPIASFLRSPAGDGGLAAAALAPTRGDVGRDNGPRRRPAGAASSTPPRPAAASASPAAPHAKSMPLPAASPEPYPPRGAGVGRGGGGGVRSGSGGFGSSVSPSGARGDDSGGRDDVDPASLRGKILSLYRRREPQRRDHIATVDAMLEMYRGREDDLVRALASRYGPLEEPDYRAQLIAVYETHDPEKIPSAGAVLEMYAKREGELFAHLAARYADDGILEVYEAEQQQQQQQQLIDDAGSGGDRASVPGSPLASPRGGPLRSDHRERLQRLADEHPRDDIDVDGLLAKYAGYEEELVSRMEARYEAGATADADRDALQYRPPRRYKERLVRFFARHAPDKLADPTVVDTMLRRFQGKEEKLFEMISARYGAEVPGSDDDDDDDDDGYYEEDPAPEDDDEPEEPAIALFNHLMTTTDQFKDRPDALWEAIQRKFETAKEVTPPSTVRTVVTQPEEGVADDDVPMPLPKKRSTAACPKCNHTYSLKHPPERCRVCGWWFTRPKRATVTLPPETPRPAVTPQAVHADYLSGSWMWYRRHPTLATGSKTWKRAWFLLRDGTALVRKSRHNEGQGFVLKLQNVLHARSYETDEALPRPRAQHFVFALTLDTNFKKTSFYSQILVCAESMEMKTQWVVGLREALAALAAANKSTHPLLSHRATAVPTMRVHHNDPELLNAQRVRSMSPDRPQDASISGSTLIYFQVEGLSVWDAAYCYIHGSYFMAARQSEARKNAEHIGLKEDHMWYFPLEWTARADWCRIEQLAPPPGLNIAHVGLRLQFAKKLVFLAAPQRATLDRLQRGVHRGLAHGRTQRSHPPAFAKQCKKDPFGVPECFKKPKPFEPGHGNKRALRPGTWELLAARAVAQEAVAYKLLVNEEKEAYAVAKEGPNLEESKLSYNERVLRRQIEEEETAAREHELVRAVAERDTVVCARQHAAGRCAPMVAHSSVASSMSAPTSDGVVGGGRVVQTPVDASGYMRSFLDGL